MCAQQMAPSWPTTVLMSVKVEGSRTGAQMMHYIGTLCVYCTMVFGCCRNTVAKMHVRIALIRIFFAQRIRTANGMQMRDGRDERQSERGREHEHDAFVSISGGL